MPGRYSRLDNLSPVQSEMQADSVNVGRSAHDCSHVVSGNTMYGLLTPVLCMEVVPNEDIDLSAVASLEFRNPSTRPLLNNSRVFFHARYNRLTDLWEGAKNWLDNGRRGSVMLTRPNAIYRKSVSYDLQGTHLWNLDVDANTPLSLLSFLRLPPSALQVTLNDEAPLTPLRQFQAAYTLTSDGSDANKSIMKPLSSVPDYFPADCLMAYQRNWRDFYSNKNLLQNNEYWFPDNEEHFILSYECENAVAIRYGDEDFSKTADSTTMFPTADVCQALNIFGHMPTNQSAETNAWKTITPEPNNPSTVASSANTSVYRSPNLAGIKFVQFPGDRFTTASPFPDFIRGDIPSATLNKSDYVILQRGSSYFPVDGLASLPNDPNTVLNWEYGTAHHATIATHDSQGSYPASLHVPNSVLTMSDVYTLETLTAFRRRLGLTNGDYNEMIRAQYGVDPHTHNRSATYVGGFYQNFAFSSVVQTSESDETPLGTKAGQGVSAGSGSLGHIHTPDFGWLSVYMFVTYEPMYVQGKPRQYSKKSNLEMYFPIFNNLPAQGIRNDELFISGDADKDAQPFAYEDRYAEFKSIPNTVLGFMALGHDLAAYDSSKVMSRRFKSLPALNSNFVSMIPENVDMEVFSVFDEPPFDFSIGFNIRRVFPGPYTAIEGSLSSPVLNSY